MVVQMHCHNVMTMTKEMMTTKMWWYFQTTYLYKHHTWNG